LFSKMFEAHSARADTIANINFNWGQWLFKIFAAPGQWPFQKFFCQK
jgi:hypothetical protein